MCITDLTCVRGPPPSLSLSLSQDKMETDVWKLKTVRDWHQSQGWPSPTVWRPVPGLIQFVGWGRTTSLFPFISQVPFPSNGEPTLSRAGYVPMFSFMCLKNEIKLWIIIKFISLLREGVGHRGISRSGDFLKGGERDCDIRDAKKYRFTVKSRFVKQASHQ